ncbi:uncharacterized protein LOC122085694 [Macadamia integrifolia]|uniref:uncharacterized protein LOC122085694 n=1 Tax=Macadamia integrifolia TaxID=60698 RepID=UPI001C4EB6F3|nr:uncharacterized protein LOC122085694 [Macadamia integrifolia]
MHVMQSELVKRMVVIVHGTISRVLKPVKQEMRKRGDEKKGLLEEKQLLPIRGQMLFHSLVSILITKTLGHVTQEYCWDYQTLLECLLESLAQPPLDTFSNEVRGTMSLKWLSPCISSAHWSGTSSQLERKFLSRGI